MTCVTRSDQVLVVRAPSLRRDPTKERDASEPSRVKTWTSARTDRKGCIGCGVNIYADGVSAAALRGVLAVERGGVFAGVRALIGDLGCLTGQRPADLCGDFMGDPAHPRMGDLSGDLHGVAALAKRKVGV